MFDGESGWLWLGPGGWWVVARFRGTVAGLIGLVAGRGDRGCGPVVLWVGVRGRGRYPLAAGMALSLWKAARSSAVHGHSCWSRSRPRRPWNASRAATCKSR
jgi:hypothetical protein